MYSIGDPKDVKDGVCVCVRPFEYMGVSSVGGNSLGWS